MEDELHFLRERVLELEAKVKFLESHPTIRAGLQGENVVAAIINGSRTSGNAAFDVTSPGGLRIEVKKSRLGAPNSRARTLRWQWGRILGVSGKKSYDFLVLVGDKDGRYLALYRDQSGPYVFFCVPFLELEPLMTNGDMSNTRSIALTSNPRAANRSAARRLFSEYQTTAEELAERFSIAN